MQGSFEKHCVKERDCLIRFAIDLHSEGSADLRKLKRLKMAMATMMCCQLVYGPASASSGVPKASMSRGTIAAKSSDLHENRRHGR